MIEVFKTNVEDPNEAIWLIDQITRIFSDYVVNFDLEDCDRVMRVKREKGTIDSTAIIALLSTSGFAAEVLEDEIGMTK
jgi:hypothetical protein